MWKRFLYGLLVLGFTITNSFAQTEIGKTYVLENDTSQETTTSVSTSVFVPNQTSIYGFSVAPTRSYAFSTYAALYDESSSTSHSLNNLQGEAEAGSGQSESRDFPRPKKLSNGLTIVLGPYSCVTIDYAK